jgi:hypothetical protein
MANNIQKVNTIDTSLFSLTDTKPLGKMGGKKCTLLYNNKSFVVQLPKMRCIHGISAFDPATMGNKDGNTEANDNEEKATSAQKIKYSVQLALESDKEKIKEKIRRLKEEIIEGCIDELVKNKCLNENWLKLKKVGKSDEIIKQLIEGNFRSGVTIPCDKDGNILDKYTPFIKVNLPYWNEEFTCSFYNKNKEKVDDIPNINVKGGYITAVVRCSVWIVSGKCGVKWDLIQATYEEGIQRITELVISNSDDEDEEKEKEQFIGDNTTTTNVQINENEKLEGDITVDNSDNSDDDL